MRFVILIIFFLLAFCKCSHVQKENFTTEKTKTDNSYPSQIIKARKELLIVLGLNDISKGVDSFEIRFGYNTVLFIGQDFYVLKYVNEKWYGFHYYYELKGNVGDNEEDVNYSAKLTDLRDTFSIQKPFYPTIP